MSMTPFGSSFDPFRRMNSMMNAMERNFFEPFSMAHGFAHPSFDISPSLMTGQRSFGMRLDVHETDDGFKLSADLPGMRKEDITVDVDNETNMLTVSGERRQETEETNQGADGQSRYRYVERSYGTASRSVRLPDTADVSKGSAVYEHGVLTLTFPKREALPAPRTKIAIMDGTET